MLVKGTRSLTMLEATCRLCFVAARRHVVLRLQERTRLNPTTSNEPALVCLRYRRDADDAKGRADGLRMNAVSCAEVSRVLCCGSLQYPMSEVSSSADSPGLRSWARHSRVGCVDRAGGPHTSTGLSEAEEVHDWWS